MTSLLFYVADLPSPDVTSTSDAVHNIGDQFTLQCNASVVPFLTVEPTLMWVGPGGGVLTSGSGASLTHSVNVDSTSTAGVYVCQVMIDVEEIDLLTASERRTTLSVQSKKAVEK